MTVVEYHHAGFDHYFMTAAAGEAAGIDRLLQAAAARVREAGWVPVNIDTTVVAQAPTPQDVETEA